MEAGRKYSQSCHRDANETEQSPLSLPQLMCCSYFRKSEYSLVPKRTHSLTHTHTRLSIQLPPSVKWVLTVVLTELALTFVRMHFGIFHLLFTLVWYLRLCSETEDTDSSSENVFLWKEKLNIKCSVNVNCWSTSKFVIALWIFNTVYKDGWNYTFPEVLPICALNGHRLPLLTTSWDVEKWQKSVYADISLGGWTTSR